MDKREIRKEILKLRDNMSLEERKKASLLMTERMLGHQWYYLSEVILGFASYGSEIDTTMLLEETLHKGKALYLPKVVGNDMHFYRVYHLEDLQEGYKGILEPAVSCEEYVYDENIAAKTLLLQPGVAFDPYRNRIGYGKGFYDRYLADKPQLLIRNIGIGYKMQQVPEIPVEETDLKPYQVLLF